MLHDMVCYTTSDGQRVNIRTLSRHNCTFMIQILPDYLPGVLEGIILVIVSYVQNITVTQ